MAAVAAHEAELRRRRREGLVPGVGVAGAWRGFHGVGVAEVLRRRRRGGRGGWRLRLHGESERERREQRA